VSFLEMALAKFGRKRGAAEHDCCSEEVTGQPRGGGSPNSDGLRTVDRGAKMKKKKGEEGPGLLQGKEVFEGSLS